MGQKINLILTFFLLTVAILTAQEPDVYTYKKRGEKELSAHVFIPDSNKFTGKRPAAVMFHGGGWVIGMPEWTYGTGRRLAEQGLVTVGIEYILSDTPPYTPLDAMKDTRAAIRWIRKYADELNVDKNKVAAIGWSAGGHLAACTAIFQEESEYSEYSCSPDAMVLYYPALKITKDNWYKKLLRGEAPEKDSEPVAHVRKGLPPTIILNGRHDNVTPLSGNKEFTDLMHKYGNKCELEIFEGVGHRFIPDSLDDWKENPVDKKNVESCPQKGRQLP